EQKERLTKRQTESAEAYQLYLQGRYYWHKSTDEARIKSGDYFQRAIERDPNYALAYAGLADSYAVMAFYGQMPPKEALRKSEEGEVPKNRLEIGERLTEHKRGREEGGGKSRGGEVRKRARDRGREGGRYTGRGTRKGAGS